MDAPIAGYMMPVSRRKRERAEKAIRSGTGVPSGAEARVPRHRDSLRSRFSAQLGEYC